MKVIKTIAWVGAMTMASLLAAGCCDKENAQIKTLQSENDLLKGQRDGMQADLDNARETETNLRNQLAAKDQELSAARKGVKVEIPTPAKTTAEGWEKGLIGDRVTVGTDILFKPGEAKLTDQGKHKLDEIANTLKTTYKGTTIRVYGYTDSDPILKTRNLWSDNLHLSLIRSMAVVHYLYSHGIGKERVETIGMGDTHFVTTNKSKEGKAKNRRVEIIVIKAATSH